MDSKEINILALLSRLAKIKNNDVWIEDYIIPEVEVFLKEKGSAPQCLLDFLVDLKRERDYLSTRRSYQTGFSPTDQEQISSEIITLLESILHKKKSSQTRSGRR